MKALSQLATRNFESVQAEIVDAAITRNAVVAVLTFALFLAQIALLGLEV